MIDKMKTIGGTAIGVAVMVGMLFLGIAMLKGTASVGAWALPFLSTAVGYAAVYGLPLLILLALTRATRPAASFGFVIASYLFGITLWIWALLFVLYTWGWFAVIVGLGMAGVGVVPIALLAAVLRAEWSILGQLALGLVLTFGCRAFGFYLAAKIDERADQSAAVEYQLR
jgi:hypothetical protein